MRRGAGSCGIGGISSKRSFIGVTGGLSRTLIFLVAHPLGVIVRIGRGQVLGGMSKRFSNEFTSTICGLAGESGVAQAYFEISPDQVRLKVCSHRGFVSDRSVNCIDCYHYLSSFHLGVFE